MTIAKITRANLSSTIAKIGKRKTARQLRKAARICGRKCFSNSPEAIACGHSLAKAARLASGR